MALEDLDSVFLKEGGGFLITLGYFVSRVCFCFVVVDCMASLFVSKICKED